jgi:hypothetical protein
MNQNEIDGLAPDMEMSTKEAAAYLSGPVGYALSTKAMYGLKSLGRGPVTEKRGRNLVYRKSALDAFLSRMARTHWRGRPVCGGTLQTSTRPLLPVTQTFSPRNSWKH